jgi:hypothetical protein
LGTEFKKILILRYISDDIHDTTLTLMDIDKDPSLTLIFEQFSPRLYYHVNSKIREFLSHGVFKDSGFGNLDVIDQDFMVKAILVYCLITDNLVITSSSKIRVIDNVIKDLIGSSVGEISEHIDIYDPYTLTVFLVKKLYTVNIIENIADICKVSVDPRENIELSKIKFLEPKILELELAKVRVRLIRMFHPSYLI